MSEPPGNSAGGVAVRPTPPASSVVTNGRCAKGETNATDRFGPQTRVTVDLHDAFRADCRLRYAGIDSIEIGATIADAIIGRGPTLRRKAGEVSRVLAILDELERSDR